MFDSTDVSRVLDQCKQATQDTANRMAEKRMSAAERMVELWRLKKKYSQYEFWLHFEEHRLRIDIKSSAWELLDHVVSIQEIPESDW